MSVLTVTVNVNNNVVPLCRLNTTGEPFTSSFAQVVHVICISAGQFIDGYMRERHVLQSKSAINDWKENRVTIYCKLIITNN